MRSLQPDGANLAIIAAPLPRLAVSLVVGQTEPEWQGWRSPLHDTQGTELPAPTALYEWRTAGPSRLVTLLYPTPADQDCPVRAVAADPDVNATAIVLTLEDGAEVVLDEAEYPVE